MRGQDIGQKRPSKPLVLKRILFGKARMYAPEQDMCQPHTQRQMLVVYVIIVSARRGANAPRQNLLC